MREPATGATEAQQPVSREAGSTWKDPVPSQAARHRGADVCCAHICLSVVLFKVTAEFGTRQRLQRLQTGFQLVPVGPDVNQAPPGGEPSRCERCLGAAAAPAGHRRYCCLSSSLGAQTRLLLCLLKPSCPHQVSLEAQSEDAVPSGSSWKGLPGVFSQPGGAAFGPLFGEAFGEPPCGAHCSAAAICGWTLPPVIHWPAFAAPAESGCLLCPSVYI